MHGSVLMQARMLQHGDQSHPPKRRSYKGRALLQAARCKKTWDRQGWIFHQDLRLGCIVHQGATCLAESKQGLCAAGADTRNKAAGSCSFGGRRRAGLEHLPYKQPQEAEAAAAAPKCRATVFVSRRYAAGVSTGSCNLIAVVRKCDFPRAGVCTCQFK